MKLFVSIPQNTSVMNTFLTEQAKQYLEKRFEVVYSPFDRQLEKEEIMEYAKDADAIMTGWGHIQFDAELLENTAIKVIAHTGGSVGNIVSDEVYDTGVKVISGNNLYADSVAEGVLAYMFTALRRIPDYINCTKNGGWRFDSDNTEGVLDQSVGIIGMGAISSRVIKLLKPFNVNIKIYSAYPVDKSFLEENNAVQTTLEDIFSSCKIVSLHSAMNERTRGMIGKEHFDLLQDGALFVNTARGRIIREEEMVEALKENRFRAILDVYSKEPLPSDNILRTFPNVYCMPHLAGPTMDRRPVITMRLADDILRFANGEPLECEISREYAVRMTVGG